MSRYRKLSGSSNVRLPKAFTVDPPLKYDSEFSKMKERGRHTIYVIIKDKGGREFRLTDGVSEDFEKWMMVLPYLKI